MTLSTRLVVLQPVPAQIDWSVPQRTNEAWAWEPLVANDALSGVGLVRIQGFATWNGVNPKTNESFRVLYDDGAADWYVDSIPVLPPGEEVLVHDSIQDLRTTATSHLVRFKTLQLAFTTTDIPATNQGFVTHRNPQDVEVHDIRIEVRRYATNELIPCGSTVSGAGRVRLEAFVTSPVDTVADFHMHHERSDSGIPGPDQDGDPTTRRWWELGIDRIALKAGVEKKVPVTSAIQTPPGTHTFHFGQQHTPGTLPHQGFCSFTTGPNP